jgi:hypothetical protein
MRRVVVGGVEERHVVRQRFAASAVEATLRFYHGRCFAEQVLGFLLYAWP